MRLIHCFARIERSQIWIDVQCAICPSSCLGLKLCINTTQALNCDETRQAISGSLLAAEAMPPTWPQPAQLPVPGCLLGIIVALPVILEGVGLVVAACAAVCPRRCRAARQCRRRLLARVLLCLLFLQQGLLLHPLHLLLQAARQHHAKSAVHWAARMSSPCSAAMPAVHA